VATAACSSPAADRIAAAIAPCGPIHADSVADSSSSAATNAAKPRAWAKRNIRLCAVGGGTRSPLPARNPSKPPASSTAPVASSSGNICIASGGDIAHRIGTHRLSEARLASSAAATAERSRAGVSRARWPKPITAAVDDT
jgi:hypothetical protein